MSLLIEAEWKKFSEMVIPRDCSIVQYNETKKAFCAGFVSCFAAVDELTQLDEEKAVVEIGKFKQLSTAFALKYMIAEMEWQKEKKDK